MTRPPLDPVYLVPAETSALLGALSTISHEQVEALTAAHGTLTVSEWCRIAVSAAGQLGDYFAPVPDAEKAAQANLDTIAQRASQHAAPAGAASADTPTALLAPVASLG